MKCRHCAADVSLTFVDLGYAPPSNAYLTAAQLEEPELTFPLKVLVCEQCWLVQTKDFARADELFDADYAYFSSTSKSWLVHARQFVEMAIKRFKLDQSSHVIEIASNDGYLLRNFVNAQIPCLGIEPTASTSDAAEQLGIEQCRAFFGEELATKLKANGKSADLVICNNVLAHVPDINDFCAGIKTVLNPNGVVSFEFPHLLNLIEQKQFDTIYHEHFSYLSLGVVERILRKVGFEIFDAEQLSTHGGSLRVFAGHQGVHPIAQNVDDVLARETEFGLFDRNTYLGFQTEVEKIKDAFLRFLLDAKAQGKAVAAYGAAAKGNTLLNFAGVRCDLISFVCDGAISKQGKYLPGSHIPILAPDELATQSPDIVVIFPWNIASEIVQQNEQLKINGTHFVIAIPEIQLV
ncbi:methyltransferase domain-containing protein [Maritalea sp.]|uniref:methyltransferase domain-containing protein n=1 Tax=Maritalea sp. TaxID=2003361 RepID=UPI003EF6D440